MLTPLASVRSLTFGARQAGLPFCSPSLTWRKARAKRSSWPAVMGRAMLARSCSVAGVAMRVRARTFAYDRRAAAKWARMTGSSRNARATRTCSRAVPGATWHFRASQAAQDGISQEAHPSRSSKSATRRR
jgi:hypothetical protein